jgi:hypothetical protein
MPVRHRPSPGDRIDAAELITMTPRVPQISKVATMTALLAIFLAALAILAISYIWISVILVIPAVWLSFIAARHVDPLSIGSFIYTHWTTRDSRIPSIQSAPAGRRTTAKSITAGTWVCLIKDYEQACRNFRSVNGRSASPPPAEYRLVVATFPVDGHNQLVAFSDGTSVTWNSASAVTFLDQEGGPLYAYDGNDADEMDAAKALIGLVGFLYSKLKPATIRETIDFFGDELESDTRRALLVAQWWRLVTFTYNGSNFRRSRNDHDPNNWLIQLSWAGRNWHLAHCIDPSTLYKEHRSMHHDSSDRPSINIGTFTGILNYAGKNVSGSHTAKISQKQPSDDEVLSWLREVLGLREIPWSDSELTDVRYTIEEAIEQQNPRASGLKQAVITLGNICQQVAIGVAGNSAYALLTQHFR